MDSLISEISQRGKLYGEGYVGSDDEEEMPQAERDLAEDAQWKIFQKNTFTRWANEHLKQAKSSVNDIQTDFSDGLRLINLVEVLSGHKIGKVNKRPVFRTQKLENVTMVLKFLEESEGLKLVNIDSTDIVDSRLKLILGLIWTLILHYSISMPMWDGEEELPQDDKGKGPTPKQRIVSWVNLKMPDLPIRNLTSDWNSGVAIGALVDACAPGLCPDWDTWNSRKPIVNATEAMDAAEQWLEVPQLITPEELINPKVDEKAMMTYLSQFPNAKLKEGVPLRPKINPARVRAFGPGLEPTGNTTNSPARFTVETFSAGRAELEVTILSSGGSKIACEMIKNDDRNMTYSCTYLPKTEGQYRIIIKYAGTEIPNSPFIVDIQGAPGDPNKVTVSGPGVDMKGENCVGRRTFFNAFTKDAGAGLLSCEVLDPLGRKDTIKPRITRPDDAAPYLVEYTPKVEGLHQVIVYFAGRPIAKSPFSVEVGPRAPSKAAAKAALETAELLKVQRAAVPKPQQILAKAVPIAQSSPIASPDVTKEQDFEYSFAYATGRGVQEKGIRAQDFVSFQVHTETAGVGQLVVNLKRSDGQIEPVKCTLISENLYECTYTPQKPGQYTMEVNYGMGPIRNSPFKLVIGPYKQSSIRAYGPGLRCGVVGQPCKFTVVDNGTAGSLGFLVEGPSDAKLSCVDNGDGSVAVQYIVSEPGEYAIHVTCDDEDIKDSPFISNVNTSYSIDVDKILLSGEGIDDIHGGIRKGEPVEFCIDLSKIQSEVTQIAKKLGRPISGLLDVECHDASGDLVPVEVKQISEGKFVYTYTPKTTGFIKVDMAIAGIVIRDSGIKIPVISNTAVNDIKISGPGLEKAVSKQTASFNIDLRDSFPNQDARLAAIKEMRIHITGEKGEIVTPKLVDNSDGTFRIEYIPPETSSAICLSIMSSNQSIGQSPYCVPVVHDVDTSKIKITELDSHVFKESLTKFIVDAKSIDKVGAENVTAILKTPNNENCMCSVVNKHDGTYVVSYLAKSEGPHKIDVAYGGVAIPSSPFLVNVAPGFDATRVRAYGPGLEPSGPHLMPDLKAHFTVDMCGAGHGSVGLAIEGPADADIHFNDNRDGTCTVDYVPTMAGVYSIKILFNDVEIPNSPFQVRVQGNADVSKVKCYGPGLDANKVRVGRPAKFTADTSQVGNVPIEATYTPKPDTEPIPALVQPISDSPGLYECTYVPQSEGPCQLSITCDGQLVVGSPFTIPVRPAQEPERVHVSGTGIQGPVKASISSTFTVDARDAGYGDVSLDLKDPVGESLPINVIPITADEYEHTSPYDLNDLIASKKTGDSRSSLVDSGVLACTYEPFIVGEHKIHVMFAGTEIPESPFVFESVPVGRADLCQMKDKPKDRVIIGDETGITVRTADAGVGQLNCRVKQMAKDKVVEIPVDIEVNGDGTSTAYYTPKEAGKLDVELRFGGQLIPSGKITQEAVPAEEIEVFVTPAEATYNPVDFNLVVAGKHDQEIEAVVIRPSGVQESTELTENTDGTVFVKYQPKERGMHELHVTSTADGPGSVRMPLKGSPYRFFVDNSLSGNVTAYGPGLSHGTTGQPAEFTVVLKDAGSGGLSVSVEGPSKAEISCQDNGDGTCRVTYYPMSPGEYTINLKFMDKNISGSPFIAKITGEPIKRTQMNMSTMSCITFEISADDISLLTATVISSSGKEEPCILKKLPNNRMGISFTPKEYGDHQVNVYKAGQHIPNSPFRINVSPEDVGDPSKVKVSWPDSMPPMANQLNVFTVDSRESGYATLSLSIEGPSKAEIECTDNNDGTCTVSYCPTEPGAYLVNVKYADQHVPGSPFNIQVGGEASARMIQRIVRRREATSASNVGSRCGLTMRIPNIDMRNITTEVVSPSGNRLNCELIPIDDSQFTVRFVPKELGIHTVNVLNRGMHIPGSPFQFTVGQPADGGADKVRISGRGLEYGVVDERNEFSIYTREAGAGGLSIAIEGPSKAEIFFEDQHDGSCVVFYRVRLPGEYLCSIKFRDEHIPFSPFKIDVSDPKSESRIAAYEIPVQFGQSEQISDREELQIGRPVTFTVHCLDGGELLVASVDSPSQKNGSATVYRLDGDQYVVRFVPRESGPHLIHVYVIPEAEKYIGVSSPNRQPIDGSPFRILVGDYTADPGTVHATGDGLSYGYVGKKNRFHVNTANAGTGVLSVLVDGPSKVQVTCEESEDGYDFTYVPSMPGEYKITIKYGGNFDIFGSPFFAKITGTPMGDLVDINEGQTSMLFNTATKTLHSQGFASSERVSNAKNVTCSGLGLKCGIIGMDNQFHVDASKAGNAILLAGMAGPRHPCEHLEINHTGDNRFNINYRVEDEGQYWLAIKWGDEHVPGSPFSVEVSSPRK